MFNRIGCKSQHKSKWFKKTHCDVDCREWNVFWVWWNVKRDINTVSKFIANSFTKYTLSQHCFGKHHIRLDTSVYWMLQIFNKIKAIDRISHHFSVEQSRHYTHKKWMWCRNRANVRQHNRIEVSFIHSIIFAWNVYNQLKICSMLNIQCTFHYKDYLDFNRINPIGVDQGQHLSDNHLNNPNE